MKVSECVDGISAWMGANCLKLKGQNTRVICFFSSLNLERIPSFAVRVSRSKILPSKSVRNLKRYMDLYILMMSTQISNTIQMCSTPSRQIRLIKGFLTMEP